jgi:hypothetical protein
MKPLFCVIRAHTIKSNFCKAKVYSFIHPYATSTNYQPIEFPGNQWGVEFIAMSTLVTLNYIVNVTLYYYTINAEMLILD